MVNNPLENMDFKQHQAAFTAYVRNPADHPAPEGIKPERMAMYAELLFNNIENFLSGNFPVLKKIHSTPQWLQLVRDFFVNHKNQTPYFAEIPQEFLSYLQDERDNPDDFPFLLELAHYEWVEMALALAEEKVTPLNQSAIADLAGETISVSPLAWPLAYRYPVQCIAPGYIPLAAPAELTFIVVYRDQQDEVQFLQITPLTYQLLEYFQTDSTDNSLTRLSQLAEASQHPEPELLINAGLQMLQDLAQKGIIIKPVSAA